MKVLLFDVDGTLTYPMKQIADSMVAELERLSRIGYVLVAVGGSDYDKIKFQLAGALHLFEYVCSENGLVTYRTRQAHSIENISDVFYQKHDLIECNSMINKIGEKNRQELLNVILFELSQIILPCKRGHFIEVRNSCINVSPIGRLCSYEEREQFNEYDKIHNVRQNLINKIQPILQKNDLVAVIGGMISIDIYPQNWDKTYCLKFLSQYEHIYFFGDKTEPGGNDHSLYGHHRVIGYRFDNPKHLEMILSFFN